MLFKTSDLDEIRKKTDIVSLIQMSGEVELKKVGSNWVGLCPFHDEKSPSFNVNPKRQIYHCFGCHKGGDVFKFMQECHGLSFEEAVQTLVVRVGMDIRKKK